MAHPPPIPLQNAARLFIRSRSRPSSSPSKTRLIPSFASYSSKHAIQEKSQSIDDQYVSSSTFSNTSLPPMPPSMPLSTSPKQKKNSVQAPPSIQKSLFDKLDSKLKEEMDEFDKKELWMQQTPEQLQKAEQEQLEKVIEKREQDQQKLESQSEIDSKKAPAPDSIMGRLKVGLDKTFDLEKNLSEREKLVQKAFKEGYFEDAKEVLRSGAKLGEASKRLLPQKYALIMPNLTGLKVLDKQRQSQLSQSQKDGGAIDLWNVMGLQVQDVALTAKGKAKGKSLSKSTDVYLVAFFFSAFGESHVKTFVDPFYAEFKSNDRVKIVHVNVEENPAKALIQRLFTYRIRGMTPTDLHASYVMYQKELPDHFKEHTGMRNKQMGYVMLVDKQGKIRWQANGEAVQHELESMKRLTEELIKDVK